MDIIHLLPDSVANQIAAGEVIQRPASCLKELVENSLDAGATNIQVVVRDAGKTLLQVIDNGKGMSPTDARMAFERHATSKIRSAADLFALRTMGFRGEALASICAVAQVEMLTRREDDEIGTKLEINGSEVARQEPAQCPVGTNLKVKNLFYNVPARRRFLKTNATELRNIIQEFYRIVLVNPQCQFTLVSDDEILIELTIGSSKQRIEQVFGKGSGRSFTAGLVSVHTETDLVRISGLVGKPEAASKNAQQYFFVNNRYMRHPYFHKAIMTAYQGMLAPDHQPSYFIYFDINPESIDVNIHPTKTEIKFADEQTVWPILLAAVRESLGKFNIAPSLDFDTAGQIEMPLPPSDKGAVQAPTVSFDPNYNPFKRTRESVPNQWQTLYQDTPISRSELSGIGSLRDPLSELRPDEHEDAMPRESEPTIVHIDEGVRPYQFAQKYILYPAATGLMAIDQHRAHIRICYEQVMQTIRAQKHGASQQLLFPDTIVVHPDEVPLLSEMMEELIHIGFDLQAIDKTSYAINSVPALLAQASPVEMLRMLLQEVRDTGMSAQTSYQSLIALSMARSMAIPYGKTLTDAEMTDLIRQLFALSAPLYTPDNKLIFTCLSMAEIENRF